MSAKLSHVSEPRTRRAIGVSLLTGVILTIPALAVAGGSGRIGTAGGLELLIPTDARGAAMGGSVVAASEGTDAWFWNPAGAALVMGSEISASHRTYIADIALDNVSFAYNAGALGVIGLSVKTLSMDDEPVYTTTQPEGTGEYFSASFVVVGVGYARAVTDQVDFGINGNYIVEDIYHESAQGVAVDMGFLYRPSINGLTMGVVMKNFGPRMKFEGPDFARQGDTDEGEVRTQSASFELPAFFQMGVAWEPTMRGPHRVRVTSAFQSNNFSEDEFRFGSEWGISDQLFLRAGYSASPQEHYMHGMSAGAGLRLPLGDIVTLLDYSWADAGVFESNHFFSLKVRF
jgi:hypothetical protein